MSLPAYFYPIDLKGFISRLKNRQNGDIATFPLAQTDRTRLSTKLSTGNVDSWKNVYETDS